MKLKLGSKAGNDETGEVNKPTESNANSLAFHQGSPSYIKNTNFK